MPEGLRRFKRRRWVRHGWTHRSPKNFTHSNMSIDTATIQKRTEDALAALKTAYGTEDDEFGATLFVSHHLEEIETAYWERLCGTATPEPRQILDTLVLRSEFEEDDDMDTFDFTLPDASSYNGGGSADHKLGCCVSTWKRSTSK
jgi:hypothetical protein